MANIQMTSAILEIFGEGLPAARETQWNPVNRQSSPNRYLWIAVLASALLTEDAKSSYWSSRDFRWVATNAGVNPEILRERILAGKLPDIRTSIQYARRTAADPRRTLLSKRAAGVSAQAAAA